MAARVSRYVDHLPAVFQEDPFLGQFLLAFERVLSGLRTDLATDDAQNLPPLPPGLEQVVANIEQFFDPWRTRSDFLPWLARWVATSLREDWDEPTRRGFIAKIVQLYSRRGTAKGLQQVLQLYLDPTTDLAHENNDVQVLQDPAPGDPDQTPYPPRYFQVRFSIAEHDPQLLAKRAAIATYIIDREKPAHTYYGLRISFPSLQIADPPSRDAHGNPDLVRGVFVGVNTTLGVFKPQT